MASKLASWQDHHGFTLCPATAIDPEIPANAIGVAVIFTRIGPAEKTYLIVESRTTSLRAQCQKRLETAQLPPIAELTVAFKTEIITEPSLTLFDAACRRQIMLASTLRRLLRPALR